MKKINDLAKLVFDRVDSDKSGYIDAKEHSTLFKNISAELGMGNPSKEESAAETFKNLDTDGSGKIDLNGFKSLVREIIKLQFK